VLVARRPMLPRVREMNRILFGLGLRWPIAVESRRQRKGLGKKVA